MKLLIFTQKVDNKDPLLGFFCGWIEALAKKYESIHVICLEEGKYHLPDNVTVYSLGKEQGAHKMEYILHFWKYLSMISGQYDAVFVHMNQEYVLLGGLYWKLKNIPVYLWRNHLYGNVLTRIAVMLSTKVFCTSRQSFTAQFHKTVIMPVGVDRSVFAMKEGTMRKKNSICMVGRVSRVKRIEIALQAVSLLIKSGVQASLSVVGPRPAKDIIYFNMLRQYVSDHDLGSYVKFYDAVPQDKLSEIYSSHEICLNVTQDGSFDKTIIESASCGAIPLVSNKSLDELLPEVCVVEPRAKDIADSVMKIFNTQTNIETKQSLEAFAISQSLDMLVDKLITEIHV
jgi:glycosyltransferase involved in cell wall biosynthesis